jgi:hypothetical protein
MRIHHRLLLAVLAAVVLAACASDPLPPNGATPRPDAPRDLEARYEWIFQGWDDTEPVGQPAVVVTWRLPADWRGEPFRVRARRAGTADYLLVATVTACRDRVCRYVDPNVTSGQSYDYYVAAVDEPRGEEIPSESAVRINLPSFHQPSRPAAPQAVALDNAAFLHWDGNGAPAHAKYRIVLRELHGEPVNNYVVGETDGLGFLDLEAENGFEHGYAIAVADTFGHLSRLSETVVTVPRPSGSGVVLYAFQDQAARSGFRFPTEGTGDGVRDGGAATAHWRVERAEGGLRIVPLQGVGVLDAGATTALSCGPAAPANCEAVEEAPQGGYSTDPLAVQAGHSYVFRLPAGADRFRYAQVRVIAVGRDAEGRWSLVFDWAHQTREGSRILRVP